MTDDKKEIMIYIASPKGLVRWAKILVAGVTLIGAPIGIGILCDSAAMQWVGFVFGVLMLVASAKATADKTTFNSTAEARVYLDKIDAGTAP